MPFKCENCVHFSVCQEIEHLPQRKMFIWYDAKYGCPHYTEILKPVPIGNPTEKNAVPVCGRCGGLMDLMQGDLNYCPNCGIEIDWEE